MSHYTERKQKDCLNCGAFIYGRFCHSCGQENVEPRETFWHLITHFVYDVTHFDGKFFSTVKYLLLKPGFLSREYARGRRMSYLNPIKMYVFTSAFFFLFFFSVFKQGNESSSKRNDTFAEVKSKIEAKRAEIDSAVKAEGVNVRRQLLYNKQLAYLNSDLERLKGDTTHLQDLNYYKQDLLEFDLEDDETHNYTTRFEYDSLQASLPGNKRDGWIERTFRLKKLDMSEKYGNDSKVVLEKVLDKFLHTFPQILFVSLPIFALLLMLLYVRRKQYYYVDHVIYSVHLYCASFIFIFLQMLLSRLAEKQYFHWVGFASFAVSIYIAWYNYKALRNFYQQSRVKTIVKFIILLFLSSVVISFLFAIFFLFSVLTI